MTAYQHRPDRRTPDLQPRPEPGASAGPARDLRTVPIREFLAYLEGVGTRAFGGPIATVGYMQSDLVDRRGWLSRQDFVDGVAWGQTMPGRLATDWPSITTAVVTLAVLLRWKVKGPYVVAAGALAGLAGHWLW
jgi:chromate transport protein ChrA